MMEVYVLVRRKKSMLMQVLGALLLALTLTTLIMSCLSIPLLVIVSALFAGAFYFVFLYSDMEYEYSYFDGEFRFAKVLSKRNRKELKGYTMDEVMVIAPAGDPAVTRYENDSKVKKKNYTSRYKGVPYYEMVLRGSEDQGLVMIQFEPDDRYLEAVCVKYSQKVIRK